MSSLFIKRAGNNAVEVNQAFPGDNHFPDLSSVSAIDDSGSSFYWAIFSVMAASALVFSFMAWRTPHRERIFHYITIAIVSVAAVAYFTMASNLGSVAIAVEFNNYSNLPFRQVFYARYIDWFVTTPLLLLDLLLLAGVPWSSIIFTLIMDEIMIVTGLLGALTPSSYKWGYWTFGMFAFFQVAYMLIFSARKRAMSLGSDVHRVFLGVAVWTAFLWTLYPIAWGLSEGGNVTSSDGEAVFYGVLDLLAKPVFGAWILIAHRGIGLERLGLYEKRWDLDQHSTHVREKQLHHETGATGVPQTTTGPATTTGTGTVAPAIAENTTHTTHHQGNVVSV
jgi:bacteriorhodopsin